MPISLTDASGTPIPLGKLTDLDNNVLTELIVGGEFSQYLNGPISALPDNLLTTNIQYKSGNQKWVLAPVTFNLSGGVNGKITVIKSGTILKYTDSFPTKITLSLDTKTDDASKPITGPAGSVYVCVELDFSIQAGVSVTYKSGMYGITGSASSSDTFQVAFYKSCQPGDFLGQSIASAFGDLVLPFHAQTLTRLKQNDFLHHTANANLQLGLGASIGFTCFSLADQWKSGIPGVADSPTLSLGINPKVQPAVKLAYSFDYAGTFEQLLWIDSNGKAHLHLYRSDKQTNSLDLIAGITANANATASTAVQSQLVKAPANAAPGTSTASALSNVFQKFNSEMSKLSSEIDSKITALLKPLNKDVAANLDLSISATKQKFLLVDYTIDLSNPAYASAWADMANGRYQDAIEQSNGSVLLDAGSGLENLYSKTTSISLNFFGQWADKWSTAQISNSSLVYAGNNIFHLMTVEGLQRLTKINKTSSEIDVYFAAEMDLSGAAPTLRPPDLNMMLRASNNQQFAAYIANLVGLLTHGQASTILTNQITELAGSPNTTQMLQVVFRPSAYANLAASPNPPVAGNDQADRANYAAFAASSAQVMPPSPSQFTYAGRQLNYDLWSNWNIALTDSWPAPAGALPDRKQSGSFAAVQSYLDSVFGANTNVPMVSYPLEAASRFMNFCADLATLANQPVDENTWNNFAGELLEMINRDMNLDFVAPATLALTMLCSNSNAAPQQTVGPVQGLAGNVSVAVTMTFS